MRGVDIGAGDDRVVVVVDGSGAAADLGDVDDTRRCCCHDCHQYRSSLS